MPNWLSYKGLLVPNASPNDDAGLNVKNDLMALADGLPPPAEYQTDSGSGATFTTQTSLYFLTVADGVSSGLASIPKPANPDSAAQAILVVTFAPFAGPPYTLSLPDTDAVICNMEADYVALTWLPNAYGPGAGVWVETPQASGPYSLNRPAYFDAAPLIDATNHLLDDGNNTPTVTDYTGGGASISAGSDQGFTVTFSSVNMNIYDEGFTTPGLVALSNGFAAYMIPICTLDLYGVMVSDQGNPMEVSCHADSLGTILLGLTIPRSDTLTNAPVIVNVHVRGT